MIFKLAYRNILGNGWRSIINVIILSIVLIGMVWMQAMYAGWMRTAQRQLQEWEIGAGHWQQKAYDPYDAFSIDKSNAPVPDNVQTLIEQGKAVPILYSSGVLYPEDRLTPVMIKGIPYGQHLLKIPSQFLKPSADSTVFLPAIIGSQMAKSTRLKEGDTVALRWKDVNGTYNAYDLIIAKVMPTPVPSTDISQVWLDYDKLNELKALHNNATMLVLKDVISGLNPGREWKYLSVKDSMADTKAVLRTKQFGQYMIFSLLLFLSMIAIFDTQILSIFKRRKEIGTLIALGLTKPQIIRLFTVEGILYMLFASIVTGTLGLPLFIYYATKGYPLPKQFSDYNILGLYDPIRFYYAPGMLLGTFLFVLAVTTLASWLPASRIARLKATDALRGKI